MATSRVVHGRRGAAECYSGRVFGDPSRYVSTDSDSLAADVATMPVTTFGAADNLAPGLTRTTYRGRLTAAERRMCA